MNQFYSLAGHEIEVKRGSINAFNYEKFPFFFHMRWTWLELLKLMTLYTPTKLSNYSIYILNCPHICEINANLIATQLNLIDWLTEFKVTWSAFYVRFMLRAGFIVARIIQLHYHLWTLMFIRSWIAFDFFCVLFKGRQLICEVLQLGLFVED